jgi:hypothetical protein
MPAMNANPPASDKDQPLREDIRLLGRLLGDTVRAQEGIGLFDSVERIRRLALRLHRDDDPAAREEMDDMLHRLPREDSNMVVRAFSYFSHLANIAEDQHHIRRTRAHARAGAAPREGSLALSVQRALASGIDAGKLRDFFAGAQVRPVLTAHPTEVQRKSILDCQWKIARLLDERDRTELSPEEQAEHDEALRRAVLRLWQTRMLRRAKLSVMDEVNNALSFYDMTFLRELPRLYNSCEDHLAAAIPEWDAKGLAELPPFLRPGSWIGGDRDGNPFVTAEVLETAMRAQSRKAIGYLLEQLHQLGAELSTTTSLIEVPDVELMRLAEQSPDRSPHRSDEPYRRAIAGFYARLAATALRLDNLEAPRHAVADAEPYATAAEFGADLDVLHRALISHKCGSARARPPAPPAPCRRHLRLPPGAARPAPELGRACAHRGRTAGHRPPRQRLPGARRKRPHRAAARRTGDAATADRARRQLLGRNPRRTGYLPHRAEHPPPLRQSGDRERHHLQDRRRLGHPRSGGAVEGSRPAAAAGTCAGCKHRAAVRDHRRPRQCRSRSWTDCSAIPLYNRLAGFAQCAAGMHAGLLRQQQGRRLPHLGLGTLPRRDRADRRSSPATASRCACSTAAAVRSVAVAVRATRPSSPSRRARCRARSASPNRAK